MDSRSDSTPVSDAMKIASQGDLILCVGHGDETLRLQVDSNVPRAASKVFQAMFSPKFKEGLALQNASPGQPVECCLPENRPIPFVLICKVLHDHPVDLKDLSHSQDILGYAEIASKYMLLDRLQSTTGDLFANGFSSITRRVENLSAWLDVAVSMQYLEGFRKAARNFLLNYSESAQRRLCPDIIHSVDNSMKLNIDKTELVYLLITVTRRMRSEILATLKGVEDDLRRCPDAQETADMYKKSLDSSGLCEESVKKESIMTILGRITALPPLRRIRYTNCDYRHTFISHKDSPSTYSPYHASIPCLRERFKTIKWRILSVPGPCLDCYKYHHFFRNAGLPNVYSPGISRCWTQQELKIYDLRDLYSLCDRSAGWGRQ